MRTWGEGILFLLLAGACVTKPGALRSTDFKAPPKPETPRSTESKSTPDQFYDEPYRELSETCSRIWERDTLGLELRTSKWWVTNLERDREQILESFRNPDGMAYLAARLDSTSDEIGRACLQSSLAELRRDRREESSGR
jgi:hypothetical protein